MTTCNQLERAGQNTHIFRGTLDVVPDMDYISQFATENNNSQFEIPTPEVLQKYYLPKKIVAISLYLKFFTWLLIG